MTVLCPWCGATDADETWNPVPGWPGFHASTVADRIRTPGGRILASRPSNRPREAPPERRYRLVNLCLGGRKQTVTVHSVKLTAFGDDQHPPGARPAGKEVSHKDDNPAHNCAFNLCWEDHPTNESRKPPGQHARAAAVSNGRRAAAARARRDAASMSRPVTSTGNRRVTAPQDVTDVTSGNRRTARVRARALGAESQQPVSPVTRARRLLRSVFTRKSQ